MSNYGQAYNLSQYFLISIRFCSPSEVRWRSGVIVPLQVADLADFLGTTSRIIIIKFMLLHNICRCRWGVTSAQPASSCRSRRWVLENWIKNRHNRPLPKRGDTEGNLPDVAVHEYLLIRSLCQCANSSSSTLSSKKHLSVVVCLPMRRSHCSVMMNEDDTNGRRSPGTRRGIPGPLDCNVIAVVKIHE